MVPFFFLEIEMTIQHKDIPESGLHETKGASTASVGQILTATGSGTATFQTPPFTQTSYGFVDYSDTATATTPIALTTVNTSYQLTNNGLGAQTLTTYVVPGTGTWWNTSTNYFDFSGLSLGDVVDIRADVEVVTGSANTMITMEMELGVGGTPYKLTLTDVLFKTAGTYKITRSIPFYLGNTNTKDNPARLLMKSDTTGSTVKVLGWYIRVITNG